MNECLMHSITVYDKNSKVEDVLYVKKSMFSLTCANKEYTWRTSNGKLFDSTNYTVIAHPLSDPLGNYHYEARPKKKVVAYLETWTDAPDKKEFAKVIKNVTHLIIAFMVNFDDTKGALYNNATKCLLIPAPPGWNSHSEFLIWAKQQNPTIKIIPSLGGASMGCCPGWRSFNNYWAELVRDLPAKTAVKQVATQIVKLIKDPDGNALNTDDCTKTYPPTPSPSMQRTVALPVGVMPLFKNSSNLNNFTLDASNQSYDGVDFDYEVDFNFNYTHKDLMNPDLGTPFTNEEATDLSNLVIQLTKEVHNQFSSDKTKPYIISHVPFNSLFLDTDNLYYQQLRDISGLLDFVGMQYYNNPPFFTDFTADWGEQFNGLCNKKGQELFERSLKNAYDLFGDDKIVPLLDNLPEPPDNDLSACQMGTTWTKDKFPSNPPISVKNFTCIIKGIINNFAGLGYWAINPSDPTSWGLAETLTKYLHEEELLTCTSENIYDWCGTNTKILCPTSAPTPPAPTPPTTGTFKVPTCCADTKPCKLCGCWDIADHVCPGQAASWKTILTTPAGKPVDCNEIAVDDIIKYNCKA